MNYELAKQLKDAGFPSKKYGKYYSDNLVLSPCLPEFEINRQDKRLLAFKINSFIHEGLVPEGDDVVYIPNLEELIGECVKICGKEFILTNEYFDRNPTCGWDAGAVSICDVVNLSAGGTKYNSNGSTPEEAVAKLWLELKNTR